MQIPIIKPAALVEKHAEEYQEIFENKNQYEHFQNYVTALMVLENKSLRGAIPIYNYLLMSL